MSCHLRRDFYIHIIHSYSDITLAFQELESKGNSFTLT